MDRRGPGECIEKIKKGKICKLTFPRWCCKDGFKKCLLHKLNKTKDSLDISEMIKYVNVVMLPKPGKPGIHELENQRGVFLISVFRSILMNLPLMVKYKVLDSFMADLNKGARKDIIIQDHLFIVNGIIYNNTRSKKKKPISICIYNCW